MCFCKRGCRGKALPTDVHQCLFTWVGCRACPLCRLLRFCASWKRNSRSEALLCADTGSGWASWATSTGWRPKTRLSAGPGRHVQADAMCLQGCVYRDVRWKLRRLSHQAQDFAAHISVSVGAVISFGDKGVPRWRWTLSCCHFREKLLVSSHVRASFAQSKVSQNAGNSSDCERNTQ